MQPKRHAPLVKTALDANTATKKAEHAAYAGDRFWRKKIKGLKYFKPFFFISKSSASLPNQIQQQQ